MCLDGAAASCGSGVAGECVSSLFLCVSATSSSTFALLFLFLSLRCAALSITFSISLSLFLSIPLSQLFCAARCFTVDAPLWQFQLERPKLAPSIRQMAKGERERRCGYGTVQYVFDSTDN